MVQSLMRWSLAIITMQPCISGRARVWFFLHPSQVDLMRGCNAIWRVHMYMRIYTLYIARKTVDARLFHRFDLHTSKRARFHSVYVCMWRHFIQILFNKFHSSYRAHLSISSLITKKIDLFFSTLDPPKCWRIFNEKNKIIRYLALNVCYEQTIATLHKI